jgi:multicomponent Na+:H+ antiporter subunit D
MSFSFYNFIIIFIIAIAMLTACLRCKNIFNIIALISILALSLLILHLPDIKEVISIFNINLIIKINLEFKMLALSFLFVTFITNLYGINQGKEMEIIIGTIYCLASLICLCAGDFITLFVALELTMLTATILIFMGNNQESLKAAKRYFLTHLISGSFILIGISYIIVKTGNNGIISLTQFIDCTREGMLFYLLILLGCLINLACMPFANWVINCYPSASSTGFIYLMSFTTKISLVILMKLFSGLEILKYLALSMVLYGSIYAVIEEHLKRILCYLTLSQLGFMLLFISIGSPIAISLAYLYVIFHILYTTLFALLLGLLQEAKIQNTWQIKSMQNNYIKIALLVAILAMINFPFTPGFMLKIQLLEILKGKIEYYLVSLINIAVVLAIPLREYFNARESVSIKINMGGLYAIIFTITILTVATFLGIDITGLLKESGAISSIITLSTKQLILITIGMIVSFTCKISRVSTINMNGDLAGYLVNSIIYYYQKARLGSVTDKDDNKLIYYNISAPIVEKITLLHNQQTAIFIVFILLLILLVVNFNL